MMSDITNWAGNHTYRAHRVDTPSSIEELRELVRTNNKVRALGTRHCFNDIADTSGVLISTKRLKHIQPVDCAAGTVTVESGVTYGDLCRNLDAQGFALQNMASLPHITVAGACATATHGSGQTLRNLASSVAQIEIVKADGSVSSYSRTTHRETFPGIVVGLGALGIVARTTLNVVPNFEASQMVYVDLPLKEAIAHFDEIQSTGYSVSLFSDWRSSSFNQVWIKRDMAHPGGFPDPLHGAKPSTRKLHPIESLDAEPCTEQLGVPGRWYERLPHFRLEFTPSAAIELQSEYFVSRENVSDALRAVNSLAAEIAPLLQVSEIRTIASDDLWMSPCYKRDSVSIHFTWFQNQEEVEALLPVIEQALEPFGARPHWGKLFCKRGRELLELYPKAPEFLKLMHEFDPGGKFGNAYLERVLG